jgi:hypothetical protein
MNNGIHIKHFDGHQRSPRRLLIHGFLGLILLTCFQKSMTCLAVSINSCIEVVMIFDNLMLKGKGQQNF